MATTTINIDISTRALVVVVMVLFPRRHILTASQQVGAVSCCVLG